MICFDSFGLIVSLQLPIGVDEFSNNNEKLHPITPTECDMSDYDVRLRLVNPDY